MEEIIVNARGRKRFRFSSVKEMVDYYLDSGIWSDIRYAVQEVVQCNIPYRDYLRRNGYTALVEKLKKSSSYIKCHPESLEALDQWWHTVEKNGGLGRYDIQYRGLDDEIRLYGEKIPGLKGLQDIVQVSLYGDIRGSEPCEESLPDQRKNRDSPLYAAKVWEPYPTFDSYDALYENRKYMSFYIRKHKFDGDTSRLRVCDPIRYRIELSELPMVYYDGDSSVMAVVTLL